MRDRNSKGETRIQSRFHRNLEDYIRDRVEYKINLYFNKARQYRFYFLFFSVLTASCAALVPVLINLEAEEPVFHIAATILSLLVSISVALQEIFRFREHWRNYNLIDSSLRREEMLFSMGAGPYAEEEVTSSDPETSRIRRQNLFVKRVEDLIEEERKDTITMRTRIDGTDKNMNPQIKTSG